MYTYIYANIEPILVICLLVIERKIKSCRKEKDVCYVHVGFHIMYVYIE